VAEKTLSKREWKNFVKGFSIKPLSLNHKRILKELRQLLVKSIESNIPESKFGILFSGGVDSTLIAKICRDKKAKFTCYTAALKEPGLKGAEDMLYAKKAAKKFNFQLKAKTINLAETEKYIKKILKILKEPDVVKVGVALPLYISFEMAKKDKISILFSGLGSEEIFAGYERHSKAEDINKECLKGLFSMYDRDLTRDRPLSKAFGITLKTPYLDPELVAFSLRIPSKYKLNKEQKKIILREAAEDLGLEEFAWRKKRAAQYGSRFARAIEKLAKRNGFKYKQDYLKGLL
jgi:asparagine synthetase B (glutamine-hydrolysing)